MPFQRPTLQKWQEIIRNNFQRRFPDVDMSSPNSNMYVLATEYATIIYSEFGYIDYEIDNLLPDTASSTYLDRHATIWGLSRLGPQAATGTIILNGTAGTAVPTYSTLQTTSGIVFQTQATATIASGGTATVKVESLTLGAAANVTGGTTLTLVTPITGISSAAFDTNGSTGGADAESDHDLRARVLFRIKSPPMGGAVSDYVLWTMAASAGATRVWVFPNQYGLGTVGVTFSADNRTSIIPTASDVAKVAAYIDTRRPVTAEVHVYAPIAYPINITIDVLSPNTATTQANIMANLNDLLLRTAVPGGTIYYSQILAAIQDEVDHCHLVTPITDIVVPDTNLAILGTVIFP